MAQRIDKLYRLVTIPAIYSTIQSVLGSHKARRRYVAEVLRPEPGMRLLDVGCGPGTILPYLPDVDYTGIDLNEKHIRFAARSFFGRKRFIVASTTQLLELNIGTFDLINISGLIHHLDDGAARSLLEDCCALTSAGGRIVTIDPVWVPGQRLIARGLKSLDSGLNIRSPDGYRALAKNLAVQFSDQQFYDLLNLPYDHYSMALVRM